MLLLTRIKGIPISREVFFNRQSGTTMEAGKGVSGKFLSMKYKTQDQHSFRNNRVKSVCAIEIE